MGTYTITINVRTNKTKHLLALIREMAKDEKYISVSEDNTPNKRRDTPKEITRELTAKEEKEAFLYTSKIFASKAFAEKI